MPDLFRRLCAANLFPVIRRQPPGRIGMTVVISLMITVVAIFGTLLLQPTIKVPALGQHVVPSFQSPTRSWCGPAEAINEGTVISLGQTNICSPIRPLLDIPQQIPLQELGHQAVAAVRPRTDSIGRRGHSDPPPLTGSQQIAKGTAVLRSALSSGTWDLFWWFCIWVFVWGELLCSFLTIGCLGILNALRWRFQRKLYSTRGNLHFLRVTQAVWAIAGVIAVVGSLSLTSASTLDQVFGVTPASQTIAVHAKIVTNAAIVGASDGNSLVSGYGEVGAHGTCFQSPDNLAAIIQQVINQPVVNSACSGATVQQGLLHAQPHTGWPSTPAQVPSLRQYPNLKWVVLTDGEDEVDWSAIAVLCYIPDSCNNRLLQVTFLHSLDTFAGQYGRLLSALANLHTSPKVLVNLLPNPFMPNAGITGSTCPALGHLSATAIQTMVTDIGQINDVLSAGAVTYGFTTAMPHPAPLCSPGPDTAIQPAIMKNGLRNSLAFHPTTVGEFAYGLADVPVIEQWMRQAGS